ncbi:G5 domain-containing protein [Miniimonas sp. S16]|uniref:aggregation-promoting factor C-terminal-like domain-containing protein n=1 Tax=Miniimonas sp. S16 TaxID=2171623 RepID=UPI00131F1C3E|nr:G5 domain-containing protein [Miniimonas sp. S16]
MTSPRRAVKLGLNTAVLLALAAGTGAVVLADPAPSATAADASGADPNGALDGAAAAARGSAGTDTASADIPLLNTTLAGEDLVHVTPVSRSQDRAALVDGNGVTFTVTVDGVATPLTTTADTLADALTDAGIVLGWDDQVSAPLTSAPPAGGEVTIGRGTTSYVTEQVVTPHATEERESSSLEQGKTRVLQAGVDGDARVTSRVRLVDGVEVGRETLLSITLTEPVTEIVEVGTKVTVAAAAPSTGGAMDSDSAPSSSGASAVAPTTSADPGSNRAIGKELMLAYGFGEDQWGCLENLWTRESGWNHLSSNKSSGAFGIPQALPGSKMASAGADWATNPATQIQWGLGYIAGRYGTPCGAWSAFQSKGWY